MECIGIYHLYLKQLIFITYVIIHINKKNPYRYSLQNCLFAATYDKILEECECIPYFHTAAWAEYPRICAGERLFCMNNVLRDIGSHTNISSYSTDTTAGSSSNDAGKKFFRFFHITVSNRFFLSKYISIVDYSQPF